MVNSSGAAPYIVIEACAARVCVRAGGQMLAASSSALRLIEGRYPPVLYVPREDSLPGMLVPNKRRTHCPHKGEARYFDVKLKGQMIRDAAWSYEAPKAEVAAIAGHIAFYPHQVEIVEEAAEG